MAKQLRQEQNLYQGALKKEGRRKKGILALLVILLVLLGALAAGLGIGFLSMQNKEKQYFGFIDSANKYLTAMNYQEAELAYLKAIEAEPDKTEAYTRLSSIYIAQERWEDARKLLVKGINETDSQVLVKTYNRVMLMLDGAEAKVDTLVDISVVSRDVTIDATIFDIAYGYTYTDYVQHYGQPIFVSENAQGGCDLTFDGYAGTLSYYNLPDNHYIFDANTGLPYATSRPNEVRFSDLSVIFGNYQGAVSFEKLQELFGAGVHVEEAGEQEGRQVAIAYHNCTLYVDCDADGNVTGTPDNRLVPDSTAEEGEEEDTVGSPVSGYLINVLNGGGVQASMRFLKGGAYGTPEKEITSKYDGSFDTKLPAGKYTVEIRATGFITAYEEIEVLEGVGLKDLKINLSPSLSSGEVRIVLTWGASPRDLDSHLEGRSSSGSNIHISYRNLYADGVAKLDLDDTMSYGPETTTIYDGAGSYTFTVHDFTNGGNSGSTALANSGATVTIYLPNNPQPIVYTVPGGSGTYWTVCKIENGQVTPVNTMR